MFKHYFEGIENIEFWPVVALIIFFLFFTGLLIYIFTIDKGYVREMENMPFDDGEVDLLSNSKPSEGPYNN